RAQRGGAPRTPLRRRCARGGRSTPPRGSRLRRSADREPSACLPSWNLDDLGLGGNRSAGLGAKRGVGVRRGGQHPVAQAAVVVCAVRRRRVFEDRLLVARRLGEPRIVANWLEALVSEVALQGLEYFAREPGSTVVERREYGGYPHRVIEVAL